METFSLRYKQCSCWHFSTGCIAVCMQVHLSTYSEREGGNVTKSACFHIRGKTLQYMKILQNDWPVPHTCARVISGISYPLTYSLHNDSVSIKFYIPTSTERSPSSKNLAKIYIKIISQPLRIVGFRIPPLLIILSLYPCSPEDQTTVVHFSLSLCQRSTLNISFPCSHSSACFPFFLSQLCQPRATRATLLSPAFALCFSA